VQGNERRTVPTVILDLRGGNSRLSHLLAQGRGKDIHPLRPHPRTPKAGVKDGFEPIAFGGGCAPFEDDCRINGQKDGRNYRNSEAGGVSQILNHIKCGLEPASSTKIIIARSNVQNTSNENLGKLNQALGEKGFRVKTH
jgi:hypothetical protein